jgi:hypothetical protein
MPLQGIDREFFYGPGTFCRVGAVLEYYCVDAAPKAGRGRHC